MAIVVRCPECGEKGQYADRLAGQETDCLSCGRTIEVSGGRSKTKSPSGKGKKKSAKSSGSGAMIGAAIAAAVLVAFGAIGMVFLSAKPPAPPIAVAPPVLVPAPGGQGPAVPANGFPAPPAAPAMNNAAQPAADVAQAGNNAAAGAPDDGRPKAVGRFPTTPTPSGFQSTKENDDRLVAKTVDWKLKADPSTTPISQDQQKPLKLKLETGNLRDQDVLYPVGFSTFVGVRGDNRSRDRYDIYNVATGQKAGQGLAVNNSSLVALSPDGRYLASSQFGGKTIVVYDIQDKKSLGELAITVGNAQFITSSLAFPRSDRLVAFSQVHKEVKIWEIPSGQFVRTIAGSDKFQPEPFHAFSPGGKYLAVQSDFLKKSIDIYDLESGEKSAAIELENGRPGLSDLGALAFSADGTELAVLYEVNSLRGGGKFSQFMAWKLDGGEVTSNFVIELSVKDQLKPSYQKERMESFPKGRRWLVHGQGIIDRDRQALIYSYPKYDAIDLAVARRVMGDDWLFGVVADNADARLDALTLNEEVMTAAAKAAEAGGLPVDADLPPLTAADFTTAPTAVASAEWRAPVTPAPAEKPVKDGFSLDTARGTVREAVVSRSSDPIVAVRVAFDEDLNDSKVRVDAMMPPDVMRHLRRKPVLPLAKKSTILLYNAQGGAAGKFDLPFSASLRDISPHGELALVEHHRGEGRLDILNVKESGKPVIAWRPYRAAKEERDRDVYGAMFLDDDHVATLSFDDVLVVWAIRDVTPVYQISNVKGALPGPDGKTLIVLRDESGKTPDLALFDVATGEGRGTVALSRRVSTAAIHPDGKLLVVAQGTSANQLLTFIDMADGSTVGEIPIAEMPRQLQWVGDDYVLLDGQALVHREQQAIVWRYNTDNCLSVGLPSSLAVRYIATTGGKSKFRSVTLPEPDVAQKVTAAKLPSLALLKPGDHITLKVNIGNEAELSAVKGVADEQLRKLAEAAQFVMDDKDSRAELQLTATYGTDGTAQLTKIGDRSAAETINIKFIHFKFALMMGAKSLWQTERRVSNRDHFIVHLQPGESAQTATERLMFDAAKQVITGTELPRYVFGDKARAGLGTSALAQLKGN